MFFVGWDFSFVFVIVVIMILIIVVIVMGVGLKFYFIGGVVCWLFWLINIYVCEKMWFLKGLFFNFLFVSNDINVRNYYF